MARRIRRHIHLDSSMPRTYAIGMKFECPEDCSNAGASS